MNTRLQTTDSLSEYSADPDRIKRDDAKTKRSPAKSSNRTANNSNRTKPAGNVKPVRGGGADAADNTKKPHKTRKTHKARKTAYAAESNNAAELRFEPITRLADIKTNSGYYLMTGIAGSYRAMINMLYLDGQDKGVYGVPDLTYKQMVETLLARWYELGTEKTMNDPDIGDRIIFSQPTYNAHCDTSNNIGKCSHCMEHLPFFVKEGIKTAMQFTGPETAIPTNESADKYDARRFAWLEALPLIVDIYAEFSGRKVKDIAACLSDIGRFRNSISSQEHTYVNGTNTMPVFNSSMIAMLKNRYNNWKIKNISTAFRIADLVPDKYFPVDLFYLPETIYLRLAANTRKKTDPVIDHVLNLYKAFTESEEMRRRKIAGRMISGLVLMASRHDFKKESPLASVIVPAYRAGFLSRAAVGKLEYYRAYTD